MKAWIFISVIVLATAQVWAGDAAQTNSALTSPPRITWTNHFNITTNFGLSPFPYDFGQPGNGLPFAITNGLPESRLVPLRRDGSLPSSDVLTPGVYKSEPYSLIVKVPRPSGDDAFVVGRNQSGFRMPVVLPDLRFIPIKPGGK